MPVACDFTVTDVRGFPARVGVTVPSTPTSLVDFKKLGWVTPGKDAEELGDSERHGAFITAVPQSRGLLLFDPAGYALKTFF